MEDRPDPVVDTPLGKIQGTWDFTEKVSRFKKFKGLKYGNIVRRFQSAELVTEYPEEIYDASSDGPDCPQLGLSFYAEDCLYLNVYTPEVVGNNSVMVWIHGGALTVGSGSERRFGPKFLLDKNIILVTINYRLGAFGFLSLENPLMPGNQGLKDQVLALEWVRNNIESFGGNPDDVTLFGESAGSRSVLFNLVSPTARGLFHKAIGQSGNEYDPRNQVAQHGQLRTIVYDIATNLNCPTDSDVAVKECLESYEDYSILLQVAQTVGYRHMNFPWVPCLDFYMESAYLPEKPHVLINNGQFNKVPIINGVNSEEGIIFTADYIIGNFQWSALNEYWEYYGTRYIFETDNFTSEMYEVSRQVRNYYLGDTLASMETLHQVVDMFTDIHYWVGNYRFSVAASQYVPVFNYMLTYKSSNSYLDIVYGVDSDELGLGVGHADDIFHLFNVSTSKT